VDWMGEVAGGEAVGQTLDVLLPDGDPQPAGAAKRLSRNWYSGGGPDRCQTLPIYQSARVMGVLAVWGPPVGTTSG